MNAPSKPPLTVERLARATGRTEQAIRDAVFRIKANAWKDCGVVVSEEDALESLGEVIAFGDAAREAYRPDPRVITMA